VKFTDTVPPNETRPGCITSQHDLRVDPLSPIRIIEQAVTDIRENAKSLKRIIRVRAEPKLHPNINIERKFPFDDILA